MNQIYVILVFYIVEGPERGFLRICVIYGIFIQTVIFRLIAMHEIYISFVILKTADSVYQLTMIDAQTNHQQIFILYPISFFVMLMVKPQIF